MTTFRSDIASGFAAGILTTALSHRVWSTGGEAGQRRHQAFLIIEGAAEVHLPDGSEAALEGPALLWLPHAETGEFRLNAGARGLSFSAPEDTMLRVIADSPIAADLRTVLASPLVITGRALEDGFDMLRMHFELLARETHEPGPGAGALIMLSLGQILLHLWRAVGAPGTESTGAADLLPRFRQLIEAHFRQGLPVSAYAGLLGVTRGRLHSACKAATGQSPLALINARLIAEATARLETTALPVEQIGFALGFRDAAYFNRFFARQTGQTPGAFRRAARGARQSRPSFAAWP